MEVLPYEPGMLPELTLAYNNIIRGVPHCFPVSPEDFASVIAGVVEAEGGHDQLDAEAGFVAREGRSTCGFIHVGVERPEDEDGIKGGIIRFLWYERGCRAAGQALLDAAAEYLLQHNPDRLTAFSQDYRYPFYHFEHAYLSDHLDPVQALLGFNGYQRVAGEVFLDWPKVVSSSPDVSVEVSLEWKQGGGMRPGLIVRARQDEKEIGVCECVSCGEYSHADEAQDWLFRDFSKQPDLELKIT